MVYFEQILSTLVTTAKMLLSKFNWVDIFVLIVLARTTYIGLRKGLFIEILKTAGIVFGLFFSIILTDRLGYGISERLLWSPALSRFFVFIGIFLVSYLGVRILSFCLGKLLHVEGRGLWNRIWGAVIGMTRGMLVVGCILILLLFSGSHYLNHSILEKSFVSVRIVKGASVMYHALNRFSTSFTIEGFDQKISRQSKSSE